ncbi:MAG: efflux RND transporter periplasmic adaptor subunit [Bacteroidota bacterium]|nr:efflux RND transporter periplasmic adaptor subunit [Bacteroidota bacterium]
MKKIFSNKIFLTSLILIIGIFIGWLFFHSPNKIENKPGQSAETVSESIWTCSMHPQIRMHEAGKCPLCGMDLITVSQSGGATLDPESIHMTKEAAQLANVLTSVVSKQNPVKEIRLYGKVMADERLLQSQVSYLPGRIEKLLINYTGETVRRGQTLAVIYSPDLVTAQQELLETAKSKLVQPALYEATKDKLRQWKISEKQIASMEYSGKVNTDFEVYANTTGIVTARRVNNGDYISPGTVLFEVADLSRVWVVFDAYESDLQFLSLNQTISFTVQAIPGIKYTGTITFIDPVMNTTTRVARVRVEIDNKDAKLKPEMFVNGIVRANLTAYKNKLIIPRTAVLWTGKRSVVYVKQSGSDEPVFKIREIELGTQMGNSYVVESGLNEGEEIVTQGAFSVDASAQLEGKPSMMNQQSEQVVLPGMEMQLSTLFNEYIKLKNAFVQSDVKKIKQAAMEFQPALAKIDLKLLSGETHTKWFEISGSMDKQVKRIISSDNLEEQRKAFSDFSDLFYKSVKEFGLKEGTAYYQYCPMADNDKGAYWLSETKTIRNPYFGSKMMNCGETKETLKY